MLDVAEIMGIVDAFVIVHASNTRLVRAIVDEVKAQMLARAGVKPRSIEGLDDTRGCSSTTAISSFMCSSRRRASSTGSNASGPTRPGSSGTTPPRC